MRDAQLPTVEDLAAAIACETEPDAARSLRLAIETGGRVNQLSDALVERFVSEAREAGLSWSEIGELFGTSKQAAQKRYGAAAVTGGWPGLAPAAQRAMNRAGEDARELGHNYVGTEHALLGLLKTDGGRAAGVLADLGVRRDTLLAQACLSEGEGALPHDCLGVRPRLKRALEFAVRQSNQLGHRRADTEHILAAIVQEPDALAIELLRRVGVRPSDVLRELARRLDVDADVLVAQRPRRRRRLRRAAA